MAHFPLKEPSRFSAERNFSEMQGLCSLSPTCQSYDSDASSISSSAPSPTSSRSFSTCLYPIPSILVTPEPRPQVPLNYSHPTSHSFQQTRPAPPPPTASKRGEARPVDIEFIIRRAVSTGAITSSVWFDKGISRSSSSPTESLQRSSSLFNNNTTPAAP